MGNISVSDIANFLNLNFFGNDLIIDNVVSLDNLQNNTLAFSMNISISSPEYKALLLVPLNFEYDRNHIYTIIKVKNPKLTFAKIINKFFIKEIKPEIKVSTIIGNNCSIDSTVFIGSNCTIGNNVLIGKNTVINNNVVLFDNISIGNDCYIKSGSIIGEDGFGFGFEEDGKPVRIPHIGSVIIGDRVEIGSNTTISRGTIQNTIINNDVKIDDQVLIAHNCFIDEKTIIAGQADISGSVKIGKQCWIAPNCSIIQKVTIGDKSTIGIGAVIVKNIPNNSTYMGMASTSLEELAEFRKAIRFIKKSIKRK